MKNDYLKEYKLSDLYKMDSGLNSTKEQAGHGANFLSFRDIYNNYIIPDELTEKMDTTIEEQNKYSIKKGDIFLTRTSEVIDELAMSSVAIKDYPNSTFSGFAKRLRPIQKNITYDKFMAFFLRSKYFRKIINNKAFMTLRASFNDNIFQDIKILIPNYETQVKIGNLFYNIECKIKYNNQINNTIEDMINTLYQRWFLEFEFPNEDGKPYKSSGGKMIWDDYFKMEIPAIWKVKSLKETTSMYQPETFDAKKIIENGKYNVYGAGGFMGFYNEYNHEESETFISCRGSCGNVYYSLPKSLITGNAMIVHPNDLEYKQYLYLSLKKIGVKNCITGSVQPQITRDSLNDWKYIYPNYDDIKNFNIVVDKMFQMMKNSIDESRRLKELRDYLLPMLVNGQINVDDVQI